jgi:tail assembly chaperone
MAALLGADSASLVPMVTDFCERLSDDELGYFCETLGSCTEIVGDASSATLTTQLQDVHFAGHLLDMFKWLAFALEVNYADFLSAIKATQVAKSPAAVVSAASQSPSLSTGTSGVS